MKWSQLSGETRSLIIFTAFLWSIVAVAVVAMALGNPTASNAALGCAIPGVFVTVWTVIFARQDRRLRR